MSPASSDATDEGLERFDRFMERALYGPDGFFSTGRGRAGRRGDFITAVEVGPLFGAVLARYLDIVWNELGRPEPFTVVDAGAGAGTLARSILKAAPSCASAMQFVAVERSDALRLGHPPTVRSSALLPDGPLDGVIVANELLDNLPVRLMRRSGPASVDDGWEEGWVDPAGGLVARPADRAPGLSVDLLPVAEWFPFAERARDWVGDALRRLRRGRLLVLDYGAPTVEIAGRPLSSWLRTYRGHGRGDDPWLAAGEQDVTYDVPLDQLPSGSRTSRQDGWLRHMGIDDLVAEGRQVWAARAHVGDLAALTARSRVREAEALLAPEGLGAFAVLEWTARPGYSRLPPDR